MTFSGKARPAQLTGLSGFQTEGELWTNKFSLLMSLPRRWRPALFGMRGRSANGSTGQAALPALCAVALARLAHLHFFADHLESRASCRLINPDAQDRRKISLSVLESQSEAVFGEGASARRSTTTRRLTSPR